MPKRFENFLPLCPATADIVQLFFKAGSIVIGNIAFKKALQKTGQQSAAILCKEAIAFCADIGTIFEPDGWKENDKGTTSYSVSYRVLN